MLTLKGTYNEAIVYTDIIEETAAEQIVQLCSQKFAEKSRIRIMPDVHAGAGCVIGFTADLGDMVIPNIVGVDIGCGMLTVELGKGPAGPGGGEPFTTADFKKLDETIRKFIPSGKDVHEGRVVRFPKLQELHCYRSLKNTKRLERSIGTLGGGNHFIEIDVDDEGTYYLVIHTGSRNLGKQVAEHYQNLAYDLLRGKDQLLAEQERIIEEYKAAGRRKEIQQVLKELHRNYEAKEIDLPKALCYLTGEYRQMYLDDMRICQEYAVKNRAVIAELVLKNWLGMPEEGEETGSSSVLDRFPHFETIHNYIDHESNIVRKGAVSAKAGETLLIPINMRDGSLICRGKGNEDWNCSAPHGAGRLFSRGAARAQFDVADFAKEMEGIFTTSVGAGTLDECPMAYKPMESITGNIGPTVDIVKVIRPVYNFKAGE